MEFQGNKMGKQLFILACVLFFHNTSAQLPAAFGNVPQTNPSSSNCNYLISAGNPGSCVVTTVDVERKLDLLKDGISRQRLQYVAHNSLLQSQIGDLQNRDKQFSLQIDGIRRDLRALSARGTSSSSVPSPGGNGANLNQLSQLQTALTMAINSVDSRLTNLSVVYQRDAVSQSKINSALQSQLTQVVRDNQQLKATTSSLSLQLQQLSTQLRAIAAATAAGNRPVAPATQPTTTTTTTPKPTTVATQPPPTFPTGAINARLGNQQTQISNNALDITNLISDVRAVKALLANTTQKTNGVYSFVQNFNQNIYPTITNDINNLKVFSSNLSTTQKQIGTTLSGLQNDFIIGQSKQDQAINQLAQGITSSLGSSIQIRQQLNSLQQKIKNILQPQPIITPPLISGKTTPPQIIVPPKPGK